MAVTGSQISSAGTAIGGAASDIFGAVGAQASAASLRAAAKLTKQSLKLTRASNAVKNMMVGRNIYKTIGGQAADIAGAGFAMTGSAMDLLRDSTTQGAMTASLVKLQGAIDENQLKTQIESYKGQAAAADAAATGGFISGAIKAVVGIATLF